MANAFVRRLGAGLAVSSVVVASVIASSAVTTGCSSGGSTGGTGGASTTSSTTSASSGGYTGKTQVFLIMMENHDWSSIKGSASAPYMNGTLLKQGAHAEQYFNPPTLHPSEPNYIWLEAGDNLGVSSDLGPVINHQSDTNHLVTLLEKAGRNWRAYQEDIDGTVCPVEAIDGKQYAPRHNPMVFFDDVTDNLDKNSAHCIAHERPFTELAKDLESDTIADYNFITPNLCDDMHDSCAPQNDQIKQGDDWLAANIPPILASKAYARGAVVIIAWDEGASPSDGPIPFFILGKDVKAGYTSNTHYTHSSTVKSIQEMIGITPLLRHAADADTSDFADMFMTFPTP